MVTIFSTPKPWCGHIETIQRNALVNWRGLGYKVFLFGNEPGTKEAAEEFGCTFVPNVQRSPYGTPLIGPIFRNIQTMTDSRLLMYVNTDILFIDGLQKVVEFMSKGGPPSLVVGTRHNVFISDEVDFGDMDEIAAMCVQSKPHAGTGMDYFMFHKGMFTDMPNFILGRGFWDTWLPAKALKDGCHLIDSTDAIFAAHQNHDYSHLPTSAPERGFRDRWHSKGPETEINAKFRGNMCKSWQDATHKFLLNNGELSLVVLPKKAKPRVQNEGIQPVVQRPPKPRVTPPGRVVGRRGAIRRK